jgi:hypothetical protein
LTYFSLYISQCTICFLKIRACFRSLCNQQADVRPNNCNIFYKVGDGVCPTGGCSKVVLPAEFLQVKFIEDTTVAVHDVRQSPLGMQPTLLAVAVVWDSVLCNCILLCQL